jgi:amino acid adenylation domain-containing protein/non-ribosomal peptide synthase protein (TIGR01720 family)
VKPIAYLLAELRDLQVRVWLENGQLRYRLPRGAVGPERLAELRERKAEIIAYLGQPEIDPPAAIPRRSDVRQPPPLSPAQYRLWLLDQVEGPSATYNIPVARRLRGKLDRGALVATLTAVHHRHETLRMSIVMIDGMPRQQISATAALPMRDVDLSHLALPEAEERARTSAGEEVDRPFDLSVAPLWQIVLYRLSADDHVLVMTFHHFVADGWSMSVLCRELSAGYAAALANRTAELGLLPIQYGDYAQWQDEVYGRGEMAPSIEYWKRQLAGAPPLLQLFPQRPRPSAQGYHGKTVEFEIGEDVAAGLKRLAQNAGSSLFMVVLTIFLVLVRRYAGRDDVVIGTPVANRDRRELEPLIGFFTNYLVLRLDCSGDPNFRSLLARVRQAALDAYEHQAVSFDKLVEAIGIPRDASYTPLAQIMFMLHVQDMDQLELPGVAAEAFDIPICTAKCDFTLGLQEHAGGMKGQAIYNTDLFAEGDIERLVGHFLKLTASVLDAPILPISRLAMVTGPELAALARAEAGPVLVGGGPSRLDEAFVEAARRHPDRIAVTDRHRSFRYSELDAKSAGLAASLSASGVRPGDIVAICLDRSIDMIAAVLAVLRAGAAYLPLDPDHASSRHLLVLKDAAAALVVTSLELRHRFEQGPARTFCIDEPWTPAQTPRVEYGRPAGSARDLAYVIYTSGSTGTPRGVMIEHGSVMNLLTALDREIYRTLPDALQVGLIASVAFDASVQQIFASLTGGHTLHVLDGDTRRDSYALLDWLAERRIEVVDATPSMLSLLVAAGLTTRPHLALRHAIVGGEALPSSLAAAFFDGPETEGRRLSNIYGPTECCVDTTVLTLDGRPVDSTTVVPIGRPLGNLRAYVLDDAGQRTPVGVSGEIWLCGPCVGRGYIGLPEQTAQKFSALPELGEARAYRTGDFGAWTEDGLIEFLGRSDDQVKIRGHRIELGEIDAALSLHPLVEGVVTIVHRPSTGASELIAYVAVRTDKDAGPSDLRSWLAARLPDYMLPSHIVVLPELPLNVSGKVDRSALPPVGAATMVASAAFREPQTPTEKLLAGVWEGVLGVGKVGLDDRFLDLGGDSIKALQISARMRAAGWRLELRNLYNHPTVGELASLLTPDTAAAPSKPVARDHIPLTPIQRQFFASFDGAPGYYNHSVLLDVVIPLDREALRAALQAIVDHHPMLRARFRRTGEGWQQSVSLRDAVVFEEFDLRQAVDPAAALATAADRIHKNCDLAKGGLFRAGHFSLPHGERLLLVAHHLVVDGVSWRVLLDDLALTYERAAAGQPIALAASSSFADWAERLVAHADEAAEGERELWHSMTENAHPIPPALGPSARTGRLGERRSTRVALSRSETEALTGPANAPYRTEINDLLLTALARAVAAVWLPAGEEIRVPVLLEGHGRESLFSDIDLSRTVGWFTSEYPVHFRLSSGASLGRHIKETKEALRRVPHHGIGYGILRHLATRPLDVKVDADPRIGFNFLGSIDASLTSGPFRWAAELLPMTSDPAASMRLDIEAVGMIHEGTLTFELVYSPVRMCEADMERLAAALQAELADIVAHTSSAADAGPTPSDLDFKGFEIDALDEFLEHLR